MTYYTNLNKYDSFIIAKNTTHLQPEYQISEISPEICLPYLLTYTEICTILKFVQGLGAKN